MRTNVSKAYRVLLTTSAKSLDLLVDLIGIEPMTSSMPWKRAQAKLRTVKHLQVGRTGKTA